MKKNLYKIFATLALIFTVAVSQAQVSVTYVVDISDSLASPTFTLAGGGMRVGGTFDDLSATRSNGDTIPNWTPGSPNSAMSDLGSGLWALTVVYPASAIGDTQQWKFVNGDWGGDEGQNNKTSLDSTCGIGNGFGGFNRFIVIPSANAVYAGPFNQCGALTLTGISEIPKGVTSLNVYPNPANDFTHIAYALGEKDNVILTLHSFTGQLVRSMLNEDQAPGLHTYSINTNDLANGLYFVQINMNGSTFAKCFTVNR